MEVQQEEVTSEMFGGVEYVRLKEVRAITGLPTATLDVRVRREGIQLYRYPASHREKMILLSDYNRLLEVIPA